VVFVHPKITLAVIIRRLWTGLFSCCDLADGEDILRDRNYFIWIPSWS